MEVSAALLAFVEKAGYSTVKSGFCPVDKKMKDMGRVALCHTKSRSGIWTMENGEWDEVEMMDG